MAITRAQQVRQMLREGTDPRIVPEEFALAPILAETKDTDDAGLDMSPFLYDDFQQRARPGFNLPFAKELGLAGLSRIFSKPISLAGRVLSGLGSFRPSRSSKLGLFGRSETLADFFQAMRDQKAREDAAARGLEKQRSQAMQAMRSNQAMRGGEGGNQGGSTQEQAGPGFGDVGEAGSFAEGGDVRQGYFLGKIVKKAKRAVKKVTKSPIGKAAILGGLTFGLNRAFPGTFLNKGKLTGLGKLGLGALISSAPFIFGQEEDEGQELASMGSVGGQIDPRAYTDPYSVLFPAFKSDGGPMDEKMSELLKAFETYKKMGGTLSYEDFSKIFATENFAEGGDVEPVAKKTMPLLDMGGKEMDLRAEGGFVPIGRMEKADDVPARLSKNEFVFTADAVRNAGDGDVDKGAEVMYNMMKNLEAGGDVSEESQGLEGARKMFQTSQRLEEVL